MTTPNKPMSIHSPEFWKIAISARFKFMKMADREQCELVQYINAHTAKAVAEAVRAERELWKWNALSYTRSIEGKLVPYQCLLCESRADIFEDGVEIEHDVTCPCYTKQ